MSFFALSLIVFVAFIIETAVGFGSTVVTVSLAAHLYPIQSLLPVLLPVNQLLSLYLLARYHKAIAGRLLVTRILPLMGLGFALGMAAFHAGGSRWLEPVFGLFVCGIAILELVRARVQPVAASRLARAAAGVGAASPTEPYEPPDPPSEPRPLSPAAGAAWLFVGGVVHGIFATGGPMVVYYLSRTLSDKQAFRTTLSVLWIVLNSVLLVSYAMKGMLSAGTARDSLLLLVPVCLGMVVGERLHDRLNPARFQRFVFTLLLAAGLALVASSFR